MKTSIVNARIFIFVFLFGTIGLHAQKLGVMPIKSATSNMVFLVDMDAGELVNFTILKERPFSIAVNKEKNLMYAQTSHYAYKIEMATGKVLIEYQFMDVLNKQPEEMTDPNLSILPYGIDKNGIGYYSFKEKFRNLGIEAIKATNRKDFDAANRANQERSKLILTVPLTKIDVNKQTKSHFMTFDNYDRPMFIEEGLVHVWNSKQFKLKTINPETGMAVKEITFPYNPQGYPELSGAMANNPTKVKDAIYSIAYSKFNPSTMRATYYKMQYDAGQKKILSVKKLENQMGMVSAVLMSSCDKTYYGKSECNVGPMPGFTMPPMPKKYTKKTMAAWNEEVARKQKEHKEALEEWRKKQLDPTRCTLYIYSDQDMKNLLMEIPSARFGTIYNDKILIVNRGSNISSYDLASGQQNWQVDLDF